MFQNRQIRYKFNCQKYHYIIFKLSVNSVNERLALKYLQTHKKTTHSSVINARKLRLSDTKGLPYLVRHLQVIRKTNKFVHLKIITKKKIPFRRTLWGHFYKKKLQNITYCETKEIDSQDL